MSLITNLSAFIIAHNEADRIAATLASVKQLTDDIYVIDSGSTDKTCEIAATYGAHVIFNPWRGYGPQKRFGEQQCRNSWVLNLDADEVLSPALITEIRALFMTPEAMQSGYIIRCKEMYHHQKAPAFWAPVISTIRLYNRNYAGFRDSLVHDSVVIHEGKAGKLRHVVYHHSLRSLSHMISKLNTYTDLQTQDTRVNRHSLLVLKLRLPLELPINFMKAYIGRGLIFGGYHGFILAVSYAFCRFLRLAKLYEQRLR